MGSGVGGTDFRREVGGKLGGDVTDWLQLWARGTGGTAVTGGPSRPLLQPGAMVRRGLGLLPPRQCNVLLVEV